MRNTICIVALCLAATALWTADGVTGAEEKTDDAKVSAKEKAAKAKEEAKEKAAKAKAAAQEKAQKAQRERVLQSLGPRQDGHFLLALEEVTGMKVSGVKIEVKTISNKEERDTVGDEIMDFGKGAGKQARRSYQVLARFNLDETGTRLAKAHQSKLQGFVDARLKDPVFSTDACYSDLAPNGGTSINQGLANGTIVRYTPLK